MATSLGYLYSLLLTLVNFDPVSFSAHQSKPEANHKALFVFGDSLFDAGNNQYLNTSVEGSAVIWPYGETYFNHPTGRISDGRIVPDFIGNISHYLLVSFLDWSDISWWIMFNLIQKLNLYFID